MVDLRLKERNKEKIIYRYYPNGKEDFGEISYSFETKEVVVEKVCKGESIERYSMCRSFAKRAIERFAENNEFPEYKMVAWG